jgi:hypothetical protein
VKSGGAPSVMGRAYTSRVASARAMVESRSTRRGQRRGGTLSVC